MSPTAWWALIVIVSALYLTSWLLGITGRITMRTTASLMLTITTAVIITAAITTSWWVLATAVIGAVSFAVARHTSRNDT